MHHLLPHVIVSPDCIQRYNIGLKKWSQNSYYDPPIINIILVIGSSSYIMIYTMITYCYNNYT